jgi:hypothetical protein
MASSLVEVDLRLAPVGVVAALERLKFELGQTGEYRHAQVTFDNVGETGCSPRLVAILYAEDEDE